MKAEKKPDKIAVIVRLQTAHSRVQYVLIIITTDFVCSLSSTLGTKDSHGATRIATIDVKCKCYNSFNLFLIDMAVWFRDGH